MAGLNQYGMFWEPKIYTTENDGEDISVMAWPSMTEEEWKEGGNFCVLPLMETMVKDPENPDGPKVLGVPGTGYVALPNDIALKEGFVRLDDDGNIEAGENISNLWNFFRMNGDRLEILKESSIQGIERKGSYDFKAFTRRMKENKKPAITLGEKCLRDYGRVFGDRSPLDGVTRPYERFIEAIPDIISKNGHVRIPETNLELVLGTPRLEMINIEAIGERAHGMKGNRDESGFHQLYCSLSVREVEDRIDGQGNKTTEVVSELYQDPSVRVAAIPAMNMKTGLFLYNGDEYAMVMYADPFYKGLRIETAGMAFRDMLTTGLKQMINGMTEKLATAGRTSSEIRNAIAEGRSGEAITANGPFEDMFSGVSEYSKRWRRLGEAEAGPAGRMRAPMRVLTPTLFSAGDDERGPQMDELNDIKLPLSDILDDLTRPSGKNIVESACLGLGGAIDDLGIPYLPCYKVNDGVVDRSECTWIPFHRIFSIEGKDLTEGMQTLDDYVLGHPDDVREDGSGFFPTADGTVLVRDKGVLKKMPSANVEVVTIDRDCNRAPGSGSNTDGSHQYEVRRAIQGSNEAALNAAMPGSEGAAIGPGYSQCPELAVQAVARAEFDGTITDISKDKPFAGVERWISMTVTSDEGRTQVIDMRERRYGGDANIYRQVPSDGIEIGARVKRGDVLTDAPGVTNGEFTMGTSAIAMWSPFGARTTDDCISISESWAKKLVVERRVTKSKDITTGIGSSPYGPTFIFNPLNGRDPSEGTSVHGLDCGKLGEDGIIRDGEKVNPGDVIAFMIVPDGTEVLDAGKQHMIERPGGDKPFEKVPNGYKVQPILYEGKASGYIKTRREMSAYEGTERLEWDVVSKESLQDGDKISIDGVKGVVQVVPDELMPVIAEGPLKGYSPDIILNATSYIKRLAPGTMVQAECSLLGLYDDCRVDIPHGTRNVAEHLRDELRKRGLPEDGKLRIVGNTPNVDFGPDGTSRVQIGVLYAYDVGHRAEHALIQSGKYISPMKINAIKSMQGSHAKNKADGSILETSERMESSGMLLGAVGVKLLRNGVPLIGKKEPGKVKVEKIRKNDRDSKIMVL